MPVPGDGKLDGNIPARVVLWLFLWLFLLVVLSALLFLRNKPTRAWTRKALYNLRYNARQVRHLARASEAEALAALYRADNARAADRTRAAASVR